MGYTRCVVVCVLGQLGELALSFVPDEDLTVVRGAGENIAKLRVCPGDLPDGTIVSRKCERSEIGE